MFGLTFEKLLVVAVVAAILIGPQRLPVYAHKAAELIRSLRAFVESDRAPYEGAQISLSPAEWRNLDLRRYDPRHIVRAALDGPTAADSGPKGRWVITGGSAHPRGVFVADEQQPPIE